MNQPRVATDEELGQIFTDLDPDPVTTATEVEVEDPPADPPEETVADETPEVTTDEVEADDEAESTEEEVTTDTEEEETEAAVTTEETGTEAPATGTDLPVKPEWADMDKDALIKALSASEADRRKWQSSYTKQHQAVQSVEGVANMKIEELSPLFQYLNEPAFKTYLQAYIDGKPMAAPQSVATNGARTPQDFMPEGEEFDGTEAFDPSTASGRAYEEYTDWRVDTKQQIADARSAESERQTQVKKANDLVADTIDPNEMEAFEEFASGYRNAENIMKLVITAYNQRNAKKPAPATGGDTITKIRENKTKVKSAADVSGTAPASKETEATSEASVFGDM